jgi:hypothetical protein
VETVGGWQFHLPLFEEATSIEIWINQQQWEYSGLQLIIIWDVYVYIFIYNGDIYIYDGDII